MKYIKKILFIFILSLFISVPVYALDTSLKVYDDANLLTIEEENAVKKLIDTYISTYNMDMVVVTSKDTSSYTSGTNYAESYYKTNGFGLNNHKDGIIIFIDNTNNDNYAYLFSIGEAAFVYDKNRLSTIFTELSNSSNNDYYQLFESFISKATTYAKAGRVSGYENAYIDENGLIKYNEETKTYSKVYDDAKLLNPSEKENLNKLAEDFVKKYKMDLIIVTTLDSTSASSTKAYAQNLYDYNKFGIGDTFDGILVLIDRTYGYNDVEIVTTGKSILIYDDARIERILDAMEGMVSSGHYKMFEAFINKASEYAEAGVAPSNSNKYIDKNGDLITKRIFPIIPFMLVSIALSSIVVGILIFKNKMVKKETKAMAYLDQKTINFTRKEDSFVNTHTTRTYIPRDTGSSGGGGSSTSRGSSGRSHGGGGRRM